ncbi:MAG: hypothetical protein RR320_07260, partial [Oscillospiraceae bacterium]
MSSAAPGWGDCAVPGWGDGVAPAKAAGEGTAVLCDACGMREGTDRSGCGCPARAAVAEGNGSVAGWVSSAAPGWGDCAVP